MANSETALVARTQKLANMIVELLGIDAVPLGARCSTMGRRFSKIIVVSLASPQEYGSATHIKSVVDWVELSLRTRLTPHGEIHFLD